MDKAQFKVLLKTDWFIWVVFCCCPVLAMPMVINGCYRQKKNMYVLFALFMGLCAMLLYPPTADLYRHWEAFQDLLLFDWNDFLFYLAMNVKIDFLLHLLEFIFIQYDISFGFVRYLLVSVATLLFLSIYDSFCKKEMLDDKNRFLFLWFVIFIIPYSSIAIGLRGAFASTLFSFYVCKRYILNQKSILDIGILLFAIYFHFGTMMVIPLIVLTELRLYIQRKKTFYLIFGILLFLSQSFGLLLSVLPLGDLGAYLSSYTEGKYASTEYLAGYNIFFWIPVIAHYVVHILFVVIFCRNVPITKETSSVYNLFLLFALTSSFFVINGRVMGYFYFYGIFFLVKYVGIQKLKLLFKIYIFLTLFSFIIEWRKHTITRWGYLFAPYPIALTMDYDDNWVMENVNDNGDLYIYLR